MVMYMFRRNAVIIVSSLLVAGALLAAFAGVANAQVQSAPFLQGQTGGFGGGQIGQSAPVQAGAGTGAVQSAPFLQGKTGGFGGGQIGQSAPVQAGGGGGIKTLARK